MSGGQRATSSKSYRPDILTRLIDLSVWIQSDFGEGERRSIACGIASGVHDDEAPVDRLLARLASPGTCCQE